MGIGNNEVDDREQLDDRPEPAEVVDDELDVAPTEVDLPQLIKWFDEYAWTTSVERDLAEKCEDYRDGSQWTQDQRQELERRGQPATVINRLWPKVNTIVGYEIRGRSQPRIEPTATDGFDPAMLPFAEESADAMTDGLRSACDDTNNGDRDNVARVFSRCIEGLTTTGMAGAMLKVDCRKRQRRDGIRWEYEPFAVFVPRDRLIWDQHSREHDFSDDKFRGVRTWWDVADAAERWPDFIDLFDDAALNGASQGTIMGANKDRPQNWYNFERRRVAINELFWRERDKNGVYQWWHAIYCVTGFLPASSEQEESGDAGPELVPFRDEDGNTFCPLKMVRAWITRFNSSYGVVAQLISPQDAINTREARLLHELNSEGTIAEAEAIPDINQFREERLKPDGIAIVNPGAFGTATSPPRFKTDNNLDRAAAQMPLLQESKAEIDRCGPSLPAIAGDGSSTMSGAALARRQSLGSIELEPLFDPFRSFKLQVYTGMWLLIRQYWDYEVWRRVNDDDELAGYRFVGLNRKMTRAQRVQELLGRGMSPNVVFQSIDLSPVEVAQVANDAQMKAQQTVQRMLQSQRPQQMTPQLQQQLQQMLQQIAQRETLAHPIMQQPFIANEVGKLNASVKLDEVPDVTVMQQEQFEVLADMAGKGVFNPAITPTWVSQAIVEMSMLRNKRKFLKKFQDAQQGDPNVTQAKTLAMQIDLAQKRADVANTDADTAKKTAEAQVTPAKVASEQAYAIGAAIDAGRKSVPARHTLPAMAAGTKGTGQ